MEVTAAFSDLHFGWRFGRIVWFFLWLLGWRSKRRARNNAEAVLGAWKALDGKITKLILIGDTLHTPKVRWCDLTFAEQQCAELLRRWRRRGVEVITLTGDHDPGREHLEFVLGLPVVGHDYTTGQFRFTHYDQFGEQKPHLVWLGDFIVFVSVVLGLVPKLLKQPRYQAYGDEVESRAVESLQTAEEIGIFGGHTHSARLSARLGKVYGNCGCGVGGGYPLTFHLLTDKVVQLVQYMGGAKFSCIQKVTLPRQTAWERKTA